MDKELLQDLAEGPHPRSGFSPELRRRIEERLEEPEARRRPWTPWLTGAGMAAALAAALWVGGPEQLLGHTPPRLPPAQPEAAAPAVAAQQESGGHRTALLIGTRTDEDGGPGNSTYRTVLIAPDAGRLEKTADGSGILMPYKMEFWRIEPEATEDTLTLKATSVASGSKPSAGRVTVAAMPKGAKHAEKLLFAGNRYLALAETEAPATANARETLWVKELPQLASPAKNAAAAPQEPHVTLREVLGGSAEPVIRSLKAVPPGGGAAPGAAADAAGESWTLQRAKGAWAAKLASYEAGAGAAGALAGYRLKDVPLPLPEALVSYDKLTPSWSEVLQLQPAAVDAFSSPNLDMVAVVTPRSIVIHPYADGQMIASPLLTVPVAEKESVIMIHWAMDPYIDQWKKQAEAQLQP